MSLASRLRSRRRQLGREELLEQNLGCDIVHRTARRASHVPRSTAGLVGRKKLTLQHDLDSEAAKLGGERFRSPAGRAAGPVFKRR
jgi:hypothetical protein